MFKKPLGGGGGSSQAPFAEEGLILNYFLFMLILASGCCQKFDCNPKM